MKEIGFWILKGILSIILGLGNTLLRAWIFTLLWGWFVVGLGLPALSIVWAIGLEGAYRFFTVDWGRAWKEIEEQREKQDERDDDGEDDTDKWARSTIKSLSFAAYCLITLGVCYVIHLLM